MTTKTYLVAYPHPKVPRWTRILPFESNPSFFGATLHKRLCDTYPDQRDDLKDAILWKARRSTVAQLLP